jgi:uncharacterized protein YciI
MGREFAKAAREGKCGERQQGGRETSPRFAFFYVMKDEADQVRLAVPNHVSHWRELHLAGYLGGPFEDRTGGLITFEADDAGQAESAVETDPFVEQQLLDVYWLKEWTPE